VKAIKSAVQIPCAKKTGRGRDQRTRTSLQNLRQLRKKPLGNRARGEVLVERMHWGTGAASRGQGGTFEKNAWTIAMSSPSGRKRDPKSKKAEGKC